MDAGRPAARTVLNITIPLGTRRLAQAEDRHLRRKLLQCAGIGRRGGHTGGADRPRRAGGQADARGRILQGPCSGGVSVRELPAEHNASTSLERMLLGAGFIHIILGTTIKQNQIAGMVRGEPLRLVYVKERIRMLEHHGKSIGVEYV